VGETTKPTGWARVAVTEGEGVVAGLRKLEEETVFGKYAKAARPAEEKGASGVGWAERSDGPASRWAESEGKILFEIKFDF
jgi:hypothetical protein